MSDLFSGSRKALAERFLSADAFWHLALTFRASVIAETATILTPGVPPQSRVQTVMQIMYLCKGDGNLFCTILKKPLTLPSVRLPPRDFRAIYRKRRLRTLSSTCQISQIGQSTRRYGNGNACVGRIISFPPPGEAIISHGVG